MVALYNLIPFALIAAALSALFIKRLKVKIAVCASILVLAFGYNQFQPSYGPKGVQQRTELSTFVPSDKPMVDNLRKTELPSVRDERMKAERLEIERRLGEQREPLREVR